MPRPCTWPRPLGAVLSSRTCSCTAPTRMLVTTYVAAALERWSGGGWVGDSDRDRALLKLLLRAVRRDAVVRRRLRRSSAGGPSPARGRRRRRGLRRGAAPTLSHGTMRCAG